MAFKVRLSHTRNCGTRQLDFFATVNVQWRSSQHLILIMNRGEFFVFLLRYKRIKLSLLASAIVSAIGFNANVSAQDVDGSNEAVDTVFETIIVTARKREETLQDVPLSISAYTNELLESTGVTDLRSLSYLTTGLTLLDFGAETFVAPNIRGLAQANTAGGTNNVSVFIDGIYVANFNAVNLAMLDLERVEVVKGPVSALYGRNAFAGVINYVTKRPSQEFSGGINTTIGSDGKLSLNGSVGGSLIEDKLSARIAVGVDEFDGTWQDRVNGLKFGGHDKTNVQASFLATPSDSVEIRGAIYHGDDEFGGVARAALIGNCGVGGVAEFCGENPDGDQLDISTPSQPLPGQTGHNRELTSINLAADIQLGSLDLAILAGYTDLERNIFQPFDNTRDGLAFALVPGPGTVNLSSYTVQEDVSTDNSVELRLSSSQDNRFRWTLGAYHFEQEQDEIFDIVLNGSAIPAGQAIPGFFPNALLTPNGSRDDRFRQNIIEATQESVFAGIEYDISESLTLGAEIRYTEETLFLNEIVNIFAGPVTNEGEEESFDFTDYRFTLDKKFDSGNLVYASVAQGTKAGGFNAGAPAPFNRYDPEQNVTYEVGFKGNFHDGLVQVNAAVYYIDWEDLQILTLAPEATPPRSVVTNASSADSLGFELDATFQLSRALKFGLGVAYTDPKFNEGSTQSGAPAANCAAVPSCASNIINVAGVNVIDLNGFSLFRQSDLTSNVYLDWDKPVSVFGGGWNAFARADYSYMSKQFVDNDNLGFFGDRHILNLRAGLRKDNLKVTFWADNVLDDTTPTINGSSLFLNTFQNTNFPLLPKRRTIGATINYDF